MQAYKNASGPPFWSMLLRDFRYRRLSARDPRFARNVWRYIIIYSIDLPKMTENPRRSGCAVM